MRRLRCLGSGAGPGHAIGHGVPSGGPRRRTPRPRKAGGIAGVAPVFHDGIAARQSPVT
ncbi:hypothetical protein FM110_11430 [Brachybacterium nesterenkovii]|uniref:Uncharacterized protein n=1 Tax=Brachybacterium nesterenkovii TaxID=47847 RepID=A0A1X6X5G2_9MICO|nr:hypothetical protein FM110_11430 [Brachybacterium nesterenkovii]